MLTRRQINDRLDCISGELKAAYAMQDECAADCAEKLRVWDIAQKALANAESKIDALQAERDRLADEFALLAKGVGEPPPLAIEDGPAPEIVVIPSFTDPEVSYEFQVKPERVPTLLERVEEGSRQPVSDNWGGSTKGIDRAFEEATNPHD